MKLIDVIAQWIPGDWGNEQTSAEAPVAVHCIRSADIAPIYQYSFDTAVIRYISEKSLSKCQLSEGDIIVEKSGGTDTCSTGRVIFVTKEILEKNTPLVCSNFCSAFKVKDGWNAKYIYYYLQLIHKSGVFHNFEGKTSGIHNLLINAAYSSIDIPEISYTEQCRIVDVLSTIESEIALNHCINKQLEQTARDLYDYWFLQFDFPDANGNPYRASGGAMTYNATLKREIPVGWEVKRLDNFVELFTGKKDVSKIIPGPYKFFSCAPLPIPSSTYISDGPLIMVSGNGSYTGRVLYYNGKCDLYQRTYGCRMKKGYESFLPFIYYSLLLQFQPIFTGGKHGSAIPYIVLNDLAGFSMIINEDVVSRFCAVIKDSFALSNEYCMEEISRLMSLRDQLLPLLMNGQATITE